MKGPYHANPDKTVSFVGNKIFKDIADVGAGKFPADEACKRVKSLKNDPAWGAIARINHRINISANNYFDAIGALFTALPLTTRMISSPGAVYGKEAISYTTDTCPIKIDWFDLPHKAFLSESSQIYLEMALMQEGVNHVYSIYNSFRKEPGDSTHLSEFHHIEYEGKINQEENEKAAWLLVQNMISAILGNNLKDLSYFLSRQDIAALEEIAAGKGKLEKISFKEALNMLYQDTGDTRYNKFTLENCFGAWEEIRLTEIVGSVVAIKEFPLLEVPFYHAAVKGKTPKVADNADFIWPGYREFIGSGQRVKSKAELEEKARIFQLPKDDYQPYIQTRELPGYAPTSRFGLGWERFLQGLLKMPYIWSACQFPRVDTTLKP
ncbi:MAG: asparagine--tRNA ligase [Nanoarchaeota archaeon]|nr:asparagine--tRNA ligase [Nanoarchaeota archaeon]